MLMTYNQWELATTRYEDRGMLLNVTSCWLGTRVSLCVETGLKGNGGELYLESLHGGGTLWRICVRNVSTLLYISHDEYTV